MIFGGDFTTADFPQRDFWTCFITRLRAFGNCARLSASGFGFSLTNNQPRHVTAALSELGFHWNRKRQLWQHPCGQFVTGSRRDPRDKYQTYFPADLKAA